MNASNLRDFGMGVPIYYSCTLSNVWGQANTSGTTDFNKAVSGESAAGTWSAAPDCANVDDSYIILPNYAILCKDGTTVRLNYKNETNAPVLVSPSAGNSTDTIDVYFNDVKLEK